MEPRALFKDIHSWEDFSAHLKDLPKKEKGDAFELLTQLYFKVNAIQKDLYDKVWLESELPAKVRKDLNLPKGDMGIDLIAKSGKEYHAIQCKYHSEKSQNVTYKEVSTFLALYESNPKLTQGYICSSANGSSRRFKEISTKPVIWILSDSWQKLDRSFFDQARALLDNKAVEIKAYKPRKHQSMAVKNAVKHFKEESRGKLIFPCGAGKSLTGFWMIEKLKSRSTLIAVPSLSLVKQTLDTYLREIVANKSKVKWLCICSDEGIGKSDDVVYFTENLGVPCQTNPDYIEQWLKENRKHKTIIFTTYQSGRIIAEVSKKLNHSFDVGIFDEAHKTVGSNKKLFSHLLFEENISVNKRIFMTATERFYAGSRDDIISMDDSDLYGDTFAHMSFEEAIDEELLTDYKVITMDVSKAEIANFIKQNDLVQLNSKWKKETESRSLASMLALRKAMRDHPITNAVSFHSSIEKAKRNQELQEYITTTYNYRPIDTYTVSGKIPTTKRNDIVQEFASSDNALITNARCLTEGVDVPKIDCIVFSDPRKSKVDIVQALGRALRKKEGKEFGYVILPVVYDGETHEIDNENFNEIVSIVRGLAANDERIIDYFRDKAEIEKQGKSDGESVINFQAISNLLEEQDLSEALRIRIWEKLSRFNWMPFEDAREFVRGLGLKNTEGWFNYCKSGKKSENIPTHPEKVYGNKGYLSVGDWLGTDSVANQKLTFLDFAQAKKINRELKFKSRADYLRYCRNPNKEFNMPIVANRTYAKKGWLNWSDYLGVKIEKSADKKYRSFKSARAFARSLGFNSTKDWKLFKESNEFPEDIPKAPNLSTKYSVYWKGWGDFLGTGNLQRGEIIYVDYNLFKSYIIENEITSQTGWRKHIKEVGLPHNIPSNFERIYKDDWEGWKKLYKKDYLDYNAAKEIVSSLNLSSSKDWFEYWRKNQPRIPCRANQTYKNKGWKGWKDFLGNE